VSELRTALLKVLAVRPPEPAVDQLVSPVTLTVGQKIGYVRERLSGAGQLSFAQLLGEAAHRLEIIVTFMAVLELIKQHVADVRQDGLFGDIIIIDLSGQSGAVH
jgi:segregation and condensation protein A